ncbi:hypothetical protein [Gordonia insulae]|uniref:Uncharacterized protein n=1 Tax=Gordonia insulae TaxID=2420509 RepID=A0A3G8JMR0_9ACTN|nr:hypothetical protein [Gordonia insulae]AZG46364.1 hypothetical protein D7316_02965 [Gordonia insulae]
MAHPTIDGTGVLARAVESGQLVDLVAPSSPAHGELGSAARRYSRPLQVQVCGRPGTGRDTVARALRERLAVTAIGPGEVEEGVDDADLWIHVLTGPPRRGDHETLSTLPRDRTIVVLGKADTHGDREISEAVAAGCADRIGAPVVPVSQLLACADLSDEEFDFLHRLVVAGETMPSMAGHFLTGSLAGRPTPPGAEPFLGNERSLRAGLLRRIDQHGIDLALGLIVDGDPAGADVTALNAALRARSGVDRLVGPIRERIGLVRHWRLVELRSRLEVAAARGHDRDAIEHLLQDDHL